MPNIEVGGKPDRVHIEAPTFDPDLRISNVYRSYINFAVARAGIFRPNEFNRHLLRTVSNPKMLEQQINWSSTVLHKLVEAGWFVSMGSNEYRLNPRAEELLADLDKRRRPEFIPGKRHKAILGLHVDGVISLQDIRSTIVKGSAADRERQEKMLRGMIRNLKKEGYLHSEAKRGMYRVTEKALEFLRQPKQEALKRIFQARPKGIAFTRFDAELLQYLKHEQVSGRNVIEIPEPKDAPTAELTAQYERLRKRVRTLERHGLIIGGTIRESILMRIKMARDVWDARIPLTPDLLMTEQLELLADMRQFDALTLPQVIEFIYTGDSTTAILDINFLIKHKMLAYEEEQQLLVLEQRGVRFTRLVTELEMRYKPKAHSRPSELAHDLMIYPIYKRMEKEILDSGGRIVALQSDRQLKRDHALGVGRAGGIPDLRITYLDKEGKELYYDLEADAGYDERAIASKVEGFLSGGSRGGNIPGNTLIWITNTMQQAHKVARLIRKVESDRPLRRRRKIEILVMDESGKIKKVLW